MSIDAAIAIVWDVLKMGFAPIKRGFGYVMSSKSLAADLQKEVGNLENEAQRVRSAEEVARNNLHNIHAWVPEFLASAEKALKEAKDLLGEFDAASKTCCRGTIPDPNCRYQFSRKAKSNTDYIQKLIPESKDKEISFIGPVVYAADLRKEVGNLENEAERVGVLETEARNNVRNFHGVFTTWKANAEEALKEARDLLGDFEGASKTRCYGTLPDPYCRDQFSTKAEAQIKVVRELAQQCSHRFKELNDISCIPAPGNVVTAPNPARRVQSIKPREDDLFESRALMIQKVMDALASTSNSVVGIYGMGGVGKSTLLVDIEKRIRKENSFGWVASADVSENPDIKRIQGEIAHWLGLTDLEKQNKVSLRAELLHKRLEKEEREKKKVLIILDNLWVPLDLKSVGIPCGLDNKAIGCKLLLTSRDRDVLQRGMGCDKAFHLGGLQEEEARALFERIVGDKVHDDEFKPWVEVALDRCAGVPFLIVAMAKLLKHAALYEWKDTLRKIEKSNHREINGLIDQMLQWSYDRLEEEAKSLLRLCVVYGVSKPSLENLVRYGFGLGLFREVSSMEEAGNRLRSHIRALQASSLLLDDGEYADGFKIHDLVREFVASVASTDHPLLVLKDKDKWETALSEDKLKSCEAICFPYVNLGELPEELVCPELRIFLLFSNKTSFEVRDSYFNSMKNLLALHLTGIRLSRSPSPFQLLKNLQSLCFDYCSLDNVAILGEIKGLQILSLRNSDIQQLPKEIGQLVELRLLDLSRCSRLEIIEPGVLRSLTKLEELYMEDSSFDQWSAGEQTPPTNASLIELNHMKKLRTLHVSIPDPSVLPKDLDVEKLTKYIIQIGNVWRWSKYVGSRTLKLRLDPTSDVLRKECIQSILDKADNLFMEGLNGTDQSICALSQEGFPKLKHLQVEDGPSVRYILRRPSLLAFKALETLLLKNMINLEKITNNNISTESFSTLKVVRVKSCDKMEVLFPRSVVRELPQLEEIKVFSCKLMRGIVEADDNRGKIELSKLRVLKLRGLPNIENFFTARSAPSSSTSDDQVGTQIAFFNGQQVAFPRLETLEIDRLGNFRFMFSQSTVKSLTQLRKLKVTNCKKMEVIIMEEEGLGVEISETLAFPMLTDLQLENLKSLTCFSREKCSREGRSQDHVQLHSNALFNREVSFPFLESLYITGLPNLKEIWSDESPLELNNLRSLEVMRCKSLSKVISSRSLVILHKLQTLRINGCNSVQEIFDLEGPSAGEYVEILSDLTTLKLSGLRSLRCIWNKNPSGIVSFQNLKAFEVDDCDNLEFIFFPSMLRSLAQLRDLTVSKCKKMEAIISEEEGLGLEISETLTFLMLTNLTLTLLESLTSFSRGKCSREARSEDRVNSHSAALFSREVAFPKLESLDITGCHNVGFMFFPPVVKSLAQLRKLSVSNCKKMEAVVMEEEGLPMETSETLAFPMLTDLSLQDLESLTCFSHGSRETRSQDHVKSRSTVLFSQEVAFPRLETLQIYGLDNLGFIFSQSMVKSLTQLKELTVTNCEKMEAIIMEEEGLGVEISKTLAFPMLTDLRLAQLESLTCFSREKCSREGRSQDHVQLHSNALFNREVAFPRLETLGISCLGNLEFMFSQSMVKSLAQLRKLSVGNCKKMEVIIAEEEGLGMETSETLAFPMLTDLRLEVLESLTCFSRGKCSRESQSQDGVQSHSSALFNREVAFPRLETLEINGLDNLGFMFSQYMVKSLTQLRNLEVRDCMKMEAVIMEEEGLGVEISETLAFPMLTNLRLAQLESLTCFSREKCSREGRSQDHVQLPSSVLFNREVAFPSLETLYITRMDNIEMIWDNQVASDSFPKLKSLFVVECNKLVTVVPSFVLGQLLCLESLKAEACGLLEVVFKLQPLIPLDGHPVTLPLKELTVSGLPKLKCVWDKELHRQVKFQHLRSVSVSKCNSLTSLFPASVTRDLIQLEKLVIRECGIAELIEKEEGLLVPRFVFPKLTSLELEHLTELKCLYTGTHTSHWPALKTLKMDGCNKVEILASQTENEIPRHKQPLFLIEKGAFPNLQELKLDLSERVEIWHGNFHDEESVCKLRVLELRHLSMEYAISTCLFVESLTNLEELVICESYLEEPSSNVEAMEGPSHEQKVILPFSRQIRHLKSLDVSHCDGLSNMFTPTIAGNLVALTKLRISNCRILTEVLRDEEGEERREVAFSQLKYMELEGLIELRCFSSSGYTLVFPLLEDVIVNKCPNMEFFSEGLIEAPKLERVKVGLKERRYRPTEYQYFWKGNLNVTIQNIYEEMASVATAELMRLFEFPKLIEKWHSDLNPLKSSWQLNTLVVDKCPSFINAMPSKLMVVLEKMTSLQVHDCESLEEIFDLEGLEGLESTRVLPRLAHLDLVNLPKLRRLWKKDLQGTMRFNSLSSLTLYKCSNLRHAFTPSMAGCLPNIGRMEIKECDQMEGVIEEEEVQGSAVEKITFPRLWMIKLEWLPNLTSFLWGKNQALDCSCLSVLTIAHCPKMRSLTWQSSMDIDHSTPSLFTPRVQFLGLWKMVLSHMDNLSKIWPDNPLETLTFDSLREVEVQNWESLENLFPHWVATSLTQLEKLQVESCRIEEIVANGDDTPHSNIAQVLFPKLTSLVLHDMPRLKTFCPNLPTLNWPFLKELRVTHCDKVNMFSFATSMNKWTQRDYQHDLLDQEAHSSFERDFPKLERLLLDDKDIRMIRDGKYPDDIFGKPKELTLACFHEENAVFPPRFLLERFQNLESLEVFCSSFEDLFPDEGLVDEGKHSVLESLRGLKLSKLHKLKRVWREDYLVSKILRSIKTLEVWDCPGLTSLFSATTSFRNLNTLVVKNSSGLVHLGTASAIARLVHLMNITIIGCERMKEVVAKDENEEGKVISFGNLMSLRLQNMPSLECFTSCILRFPSLWSIEVEECPKMKIFSKGTLSTPQLKYGTLFRYTWNEDWKGDLNKAIKELSA